MVKTFTFIVPNSLSLNKLRTELKQFLKKSKFVMDPSDLRKGTRIEVEIGSKTEFLELISYCIEHQFSL